MSRYPPPAFQKLAYRPGEIPAFTGIARSTVYYLLNTGELPSFKEGKTTLVLHEDLVAFLRQRAGRAKK